MLLLFILWPVTGYKIHFRMPPYLLPHINYPEGLHRRILRHILSWSVQSPCSQFPRNTLITLQWITERNKNMPCSAELLWLTHYPAQRRVLCGRLAEPLDPAVQGVGNPPLPVIQQSLYGHLWPRGAARWFQLQRERKISAQCPLNHMGELQQIA